MKLKIYCLALILLTPLAFAFEDHPGINQAFADLQKKLPVAGTLIHIPFVDVLASYGKGIKLKIYKDEAVPGDKALRVAVKKVGDNPWDKGLYSPLVGAINTGDTVLMAFWVRAKKIDKALGYGVISANVQASSEPYSNIAGQNIQVSDSWSLYYVSGVANASFAAEKAQVSFQVGATKQILDFGPVFVMNLGPDIDMNSLPVNN